MIVMVKEDTSDAQLSCSPPTYPCHWMSAAAWNILGLVLWEGAAGMHSFCGMSEGNTEDGIYLRKYMLTVWGMNVWISFAAREH